MPRRRRKHAALPNLIIIGGLKCGTTSIHHYLGLHPEVQMSKPKELNFFVEELDWDLGMDWYRGRFDDRFPVRGESSPHYTNLPRYTGVVERIHEHIPDAKLIYMVRDPISRILSHWRHATGAGYETRSMEEVLTRDDQTYVTRSMYWMQLQPYLEHFDRDQIEVITQEELQSDREGTMRKAFRSPASTRTSPPSSSTASGRSRPPRSRDQYQLMEKLIKLPGFRSFDRNFDRLPESDALDGREGRPRPRRALGPQARAARAGLATAALLLRARTSPACSEFAGREFAGWKNYRRRLHA